VAACECARRRQADGVIPLTAQKARSKVVRSRNPDANAISVIVTPFTLSFSSIVALRAIRVIAIRWATVSLFSLNFLDRHSRR
jgi:hypothetical protein